MTLREVKSKGGEARTPLLYPMNYVLLTITRTVFNSYKRLENVTLTKSPDRFVYPSRTKMRHGKRSS